MGFARAQPILRACCRFEDCWIHAETEVKVEVNPTQWREWFEE